MTLHSYFRKFENYTPDPRFPHGDHSIHGSHGPVTVGYHAYTWHGSPLFVQASINAGVPLSPDFTTSNGTLGTNKVCLGPLQSLISHAPYRSVSVSLAFCSQVTHYFLVTYINSRGQRVSAEVAYLTPDVLVRPNLKVVTLSRVTKIIFSSSGTPRAVAIEFANSNQPTVRFHARTRKEVIVWYVSLVRHHLH